MRLLSSLSLLCLIIHKLKAEKSLTQFFIFFLYVFNFQIIDLYIGFAVSTALIQVAYMTIVGSFPFNSFHSGVLSCIGTAVLAVCLRIQVNEENKEVKDGCCRFCSLQLCAAFGDHEFPWIRLTYFSRLGYCFLQSHD